MSIGGGGVGDVVPPLSDLETIYQGGEHFLDRMKAIAQQHADASKALADLQLGKDAARAKKEAEGLFKSAEKKNAQADEKLAAAMAEADQLLATAKAEYARSVQEATANITQLKEEMRAAKQKADDAIVKLTEEAEVLRAEAAAKLDTVTSQLAISKKAETDASVAKKKYEAAEQAAQDMQKSYQQKVAQLQAVIA